MIPAAVKRAPGRRSAERPSRRAIRVPATAGTSETSTSEPSSPVRAQPIRTTKRETAMSDTYPWNRPEDEENEAAAALQMALDRRDNGGPPQR
ncbi:hypothetical protein TBS_35510 [Thermobispora bispora]